MIFKCGNMYIVYYKDRKRLPVNIADISNLFAKYCFIVFEQNGREYYYCEASLPERWYLGCVFCSLMYHYVEGRAEASCGIIDDTLVHFDINI